YISTIANGGYRIIPKLIKNIHHQSNDDSMGPVYKTNETEVLNKMNISDKQIKRNEQGFRDAFQEPGGAGYRNWSSKYYNLPVKTGTAENELYINGKKIEPVDLDLVGYAPYDDPEIAFAVVIPHLSKNRPGITPINHAIGMGIMDTYFAMKNSNK